MKRLILLVGATWLLSGCAACTSPTEGWDSTVPPRCQDKETIPEPQKLDVLFVVDNSMSMTEEQLEVASELTAFVTALKQSGGVAQDFRIGVITTAVYQHADLGNGMVDRKTYPDQSGKLQPVPGTTKRMLSGEDPDLIDAFGQLVRVGIAGSGQETPFEALRLALIATRSEGGVADVPLEEGGTVGFLRDRARLLIVLVTDEDDCSEVRRPPMVLVGADRSKNYCGEKSALLTPVGDYFQQLSQLKDSGGATRPIDFAAIAPVAISDKRAEEIHDAMNNLRNADCPTSVQPGFRVREMTELFIPADSTRPNLDSICKDDYNQTLKDIAGLAKVSQTLELRNVPAPELLQITIVRVTGETEVCTLSNGGLTAFDAPTPDQPARIHFGNQCRRRANDTELKIAMFCAG